MENGNIMEFVRTYPEYNRLRLVSEESAYFSIVLMVWAACRCSDRIGILARAQYHPWGS